MIEKFNGYQCERCNRIYDTKEKSIECESKPMQIPIKNIGFEFNEIYYYGDGDNDFVIIPTKISEIHWNGHECIYRFNQDLSDTIGTLTAFGNDDLKELLEIAIKKHHFITKGGEHTQ